MAKGYARQALSKGPDKRSALKRAEPTRHTPRPGPESTLPVALLNAETVLRLQRVYGNQRVQRLIQLARDPEFTFQGSGIEQTTLKTQEQLNRAVESIIDEELGGIDNLFRQNAIATSLTKWRDLVYSYLEELYTLDQKLGRPQVLEAVRWVKDEHRKEVLKRFANNYVFMNTDPDEIVTVDDLKGPMTDAGVYLDNDDDEALEALVDTGGKFAATKVKIPSADMEVLDANNIVIVLDHHQNKHQNTKIPELPDYTGEPGTKFAFGKGLDWHMNNTVPVVIESVQKAVKDGRISPKSKGAYSPSKNVKPDGIIYDLTITFDDDSGKYVGSYHCNPKDEE